MKKVTGLGEEGWWCDQEGLLGVGGQDIWTEASVKTWAVQRAVGRMTWAEATASEKAPRLGPRRACWCEAGGGQCGDRRGERGLARPQDSVSWTRSWADGSQWRSHCIPAAKKQWRLGTEWEPERAWKVVGLGTSFESRDDRTSDGLQKAKQGWEGWERNSGYFLVWGLSNWVDSSTKMEKNKERSK